MDPGVVAILPVASSNEIFIRVKFNL